MINFEINSFGPFWLIVQMPLSSNNNKVVPCCQLQNSYHQTNKIWICKILLLKFGWNSDLEEFILWIFRVCYTVYCGNSFAQKFNMVERGVLCLQLLPEANFCLKSICKSKRQQNDWLCLVCRRKLYFRILLLGKFYNNISSQNSHGMVQ